MEADRLEPAQAMLRTGVVAIEGIAATAVLR
jgi:hypothetical protein